jgi:hypothetical protein
MQVGMPRVWQLRDGLSPGPGAAALRVWHSTV